MRMLTALLCALLAFSARGEELSTIEFVVNGASVSAITLTNVADRSILREVALRDGRGSISAIGGSEWEIALPQPGFWTATTRIRFPDTGATTIAIDVWRTGVARGQISGTRPDKLALSVDAPVEGVAPVIERGTTFPCALEESGSFTCTLPATKLNLVLRAPGMTPHYLWDVAVSAGQTKTLGKFVLRPGASFTARLDKSVIGQLKKPALARLVHPVADIPSHSTARLSVPVAEANFDARGFVQLAPLPPGSYLIEIRAEGFAKRVIGPLEIYEGKETAFRKLIELFPPVKVAISIDPPADVDSRPWHIRLQPADNSAAAVFANTDDRGRAVFSDQSPGLFFVTVSDAEQNQLRDQQLQIAEHDVDLPIHLDLHVVNGIVTLGETALAQADVWFGTEHGATRVHATTDEEGRFRTRLPQLGQWPVEVRSDSPAARAIVHIDVDDEIAIRLPNTSIAGRVVNDAGQRVTRGEVIVMAAGRAFPSKLDANGEFVLRGIPEGAVSLKARDTLAGGTSAIVPLHIRSDRPLRDIELRIEKQRKFAGTIVSAGRPVIGAGVSVTPRLPTGASVERTVSDIHGAFEVEIPAPATRAHVLVAAPARTLDAFEVSITDQPHTFDIAPAGGTIEIVGKPPFSLTRNGVPISIHALIDWILAHGQPLDDPSRWRVPDLAPGPYRLCAGNSSCVDGVLAPGATLTLTIPGNSHK